MFSKAGDLVNNSLLFLTLFRTEGSKTVYPVQDSEAKKPYPAHAVPELSVFLRAEKKNRISHAQPQPGLAGLSCERATRSLTESSF